MTERSISPLRRRMIEDMTIRGFAPKTQASYIRAVADFTTFLGRSPDRADMIAMNPEVIWEMSVYGSVAYAFPPESPAGIPACGSQPGTLPG